MKKTEKVWERIGRLKQKYPSVNRLYQIEEEEIISLRKCSEPNDKVKLIYDTLGYRDRPFIPKKSVVPQTPLEKNQNQINQDFTGG
ncbi:MAG: hypothetical protein LBQ73_00820 [Tannerellaceae bacterium]|nr:hypothetical protein [Tannerellaceae bacterium]